MNLNRRGFMSLLAAAPAAAGNISKSVAAKFRAENSGLLASMDPSHGGLASTDVGEGAKNQLREMLKRGLPAWKRKQVRENASSISEFETNLLAMRSVSPVAKVWIQRERNIRMAEQGILDEVFNRGWREKRQSWLDKAGVHWF
jgi:hypothetical protein